MYFYVIIYIYNLKNSMFDFYIQFINWSDIGNINYAPQLKPRGFS